MARLIFSTLSFLIFMSAPAFAGFEWVPSSAQNAMPPPQASIPVDNNKGFPAPPVLSEPLDNIPSAPPVSILPQEQMAQPAPSKNLSGKKLVIDPYPLRSNAALPTNGLSMTEVYKAMNEESGKLHPVKLGNGMTTGAKRNAPSVPKAVRMASTAHKTFLTPTGEGMTPMMGREPAPLPGIIAPRSTAVENVTYGEAVGFGRDLPLALALSQVIPSGFTHSFAKNVDAGATVSWEGGKPWNQVLNDMLSAKNLMAVIQDNQVIIQSSAKL